MPNWDHETAALIGLFTAITIWREGRLVPKHVLFSVFCLIFAVVCSTSGLSGSGLINRTAVQRNQYSLPKPNRHLLVRTQTHTDTHTKPKKKKLHRFLSCSLSVDLTRKGIVKTIYILSYSFHQPGWPVCGQVPNPRTSTGDFYLGSRFRPAVSTKKANPHPCPRPAPWPAICFK